MSRIVAGVVVAAMLISLSACSIQRLPKADADPGIAESGISGPASTGAEKLCRESGAEVVSRLRPAGRIHLDLCLRHRSGTARTGRFLAYGGDGDLRRIPGAAE